MQGLVGLGLRAVSFLRRGEEMGGEGCTPRLHDAAMAQCAAGSRPVTLVWVQHHRPPSAELSLPQSHAMNSATAIAKVEAESCNLARCVKGGGASCSVTWGCCPRLGLLVATINNAP
jgi:hypothetical protein